MTLFDQIKKTIRKLKSFVAVSTLTARKKILRKKIRKKINKGTIINVLFFVQYPEMWNSEKTIHSAMLNDNRFKPIVIAIPKNNNNDTGSFSSKNDAYFFFLSQNYIVYNAFDKRWINLKRFKPDLIFLQRPYSQHMPKQYKYDIISRRSLLCYVPYGFSFNDDKSPHTKVSINETMLTYCDYFFANSQSDCVFFNNNARNKIVHSYFLGYPRFDLISTLNEYIKSQSKSFLWTPRWYCGNLNIERSHFLDYLEPLLLFFSTHEKYNLVIRPHPLMFDYFINNNIMTEKEIIELKSRINSITNVCFDKNEDYLITFDSSDVLISDYSGLIVEYYVTGKPIIYCGEHYHLDDFGTKMVETLYNVNNKEDLIQSITLIAKNDDYKKKERYNLINNCFNNRNVGKLICDFIINDLVK